MKLRALFVSSLAGLWACGGDNQDGPTFYERNIEPILVRSCAGQTSGCHAVDGSDPFGFAAGNFDVTSFENVQKRRDLLKPFGAYNEPALLIKAVGAGSGLGVNYNGEFLELEIQHVSNAPLAVGSEAYLTLLEWTQNGATADGLPPPAPPQTGEGACSTFVPEEFDDAAITSEPTFGEFAANVQPVLAACSAGSCHGAPQSDFYITCGEGDRQIAFNFAQARAFVDAPVDNTQILQMPLAVDAGGFFHTGGDHFAGREDPGYVAIREWAGKVGRVEFGDGDPGREFFARQIQPLLLTRGCSFEACHSPQSTNDFQLRSGSRGFFSAIALERNYEKLLGEFMALEVPDARRGRAVAKGLIASFGGINHRGGPVLETPGSGGSDPTSCPEPFDPATASAFCTFQEWIDIERAARIAAGEIDELAAGQTVSIVYVDRLPTHVADVHEIDTYQPDSDLLVDVATIGADGSLTAAGAPTSLLAGCPGAADTTAVDVRGPDVHPDGNLVAFAMRTGPGDPLGVYTVELDGSNCRRLTPAEPAVGGVMIHNFDPAFSNDGQSIAYASTRGGDPPAPSLSRRFFEPQSDIWRMALDGSNREQVTFLTNSELSPQFMREGRMIMTTEKVSQGFYQLAGRRINWDLTDYHPLLGQRAQSEFGNPSDPTVIRDSIGYQRATEIREGFDGNFLVILSDPGTAAGAGNLGIFNRSVGPMEAGRSDPGFLRSLVLPDRGDIGRAGPSAGAYRSPFPLLDGRIMASHVAGNVDLSTATSLDFDVVAVDPRTGQRTTIIGGARSQLEAVLAIKRPRHQMFINKRQLVFGGKQDAGITGGPELAIAHFPDAPLIFTLLNANLRRGRPVELFRDATQLAVYSEAPAPPGSGPNTGDIFESRELVGRAPLESDGSVRVRVPSGVPVILELQDGSGNPVVTMREEHQFGRGENITFGIVEPLFDAVCGGCHGTVSGSELDVFVTPDALTGASESLSQSANPADLQ